MLKAADAFAEAGYNVRVVSTRHTAWADAADADIIRRRNGAWSWTVVDYRREAAATYVTSGIRFRGARWLARTLGASSLGLYAAACGRERVFPEVVAKALQEPVDLIYGGGGGVATTAFAGRRTGVPYGIDLEDFHLAEHTNSPDARLTRALTARIEQEVLESATFLTAGSQAIADAYTREYAVKPVAINNTFPLPPYPPCEKGTSSTESPSLRRRSCCAEAEKTSSSLTTSRVLYLVNPWPSSAGLLDSRRPKSSPTLMLSWETSISSEPMLVLMCPRNFR